MRKVIISTIFILSVVMLLPNPSFAEPTTRLTQTIASGSHVYITWDEVSNGKFSVMFTQSNDSGVTFGKTTKLADNVGIANLRKIASSENNVYVAWDSDKENSHGIFLRKSVDYGNTFGPIVMLSDKNTLCNSVTGLQATGPYVYVFFNCYDSISQEGSIVIMASHDNATSFEKPITLFKGKGIYSNIFLSTAALGKNIYIVFDKNYDISNPDSLLYEKSTDAGDTFSQTVVLNDNKHSHVAPQVILNKNHVYVIWRDYYANYFKDLEFLKSDDYGSTFGNLVKLNTNKPDTEMYNIPFFEASDNLVYVSWEEIHQGPIQTQYQLLRTSTDGGNTFSPEQNLTNVVSMKYNLQQGGVVTGPGQNVYFLYPGMANPVFDISGVFFKKSSDGAKTFGTLIDLNKLNPTQYDMYNPQITVSGNNVYVTADTQDRENKIFFVSSHDNGTSFGNVININDYDLVGATTKPSPLKQSDSGIAPQNVKCQDRLDLVISFQKFPACVRHAHLPRMLSHGWIYGIDDNAEIASKKTHEIITIGTKMSKTNGLVPVTVTEITSHAESLNSITIWTFRPTDRNENSHTTLDIPQNFSTSNWITDGHNNNAIDKSSMPGNFAIAGTGLSLSVICSPTEKIVTDGDSPYSIPITKGNSLIYAQSSRWGMFPDSNGDYSLKYASLFEPKIEFPKGVQLISNETKSCFLEYDIDNYTKAFYTQVVFRLS